MGNPGLKPFESMTPEDYGNIGLRSGLEIHRQLKTKTKLFCRCPCGSYSDMYDAEILRHMRPTLSELGEYDGTALMEKKTRKNIFYRIHHSTVCTYEFDDTPPFLISEDALDIAIEVAMLLRLNLIGELHIARKQYLDGSIPTGFQRTTILGVDGWIPYKGRKIRIRQLGLEEDSCREVSDIGHDRVYLTDRLGMPLIEPVTEPDMRTPQEVAEVGEILRRLCRSTGKVRTGYGAARQDVNVSVRGGTRIEIKGVPQLWRIPHLVYNEARRQCSLLAIRDMLRNRGVTPESFESYADDVTRIVSKTRYEPMRSALDDGHRARCVVLKGFAGILNESTQENTTFAKEFSDRVRVISCLTRLPNIVHSDTASESLHGKDWQKLRKKMSAGPEDALILVWGDEADARCACEEITIRAKEATVGVPHDTRQGLKDGTNAFERVLPGAARMYPDTDLPPMAIPESRLKRIRAQLPDYPWDREESYRKLGLSDEMIGAVVYSARDDLFVRVCKELTSDPTFVAVILCQHLKACRRKKLKPERLTDDELFDLFKAFADGRLTREGVVTAIGSLLTRRGESGETDITVTEVLEELTLVPASEQELETALTAAISAADLTKFDAPIKLHRFAMGDLMREFRGRVDGTRLAQLLSDKLGAEPTSTATSTRGVEGPTELATDK